MGDYSIARGYSQSATIRLPKGFFPNGGPCFLIPFEYKFKGRHMSRERCYIPKGYEQGFSVGKITKGKVNKNIQRICLILKLKVGLT